MIEEEDILEGSEGEWTRYQLELPEDDYGEDDVIDSQIARYNRRNKSSVKRGHGIRGI